MGSILVDGSGPPYIAGGDNYTIKVDGEVSKSTGTAAQDEVSGGNIHGKIGDGMDSYEFTGSVVSADIPAHSDLIINDRVVTSSDLPIRDDGTSPDEIAPSEDSEYWSGGDTPGTGPDEPGYTDVVTDSTTDSGSDSGSTSTGQPAQTTTIGGSAPDTVAWVVALAAVVAAVYYSQR